MCSSYNFLQVACSWVDSLTVNYQFSNCLWYALFQSEQLDTDLFVKWVQLSLHPRSSSLEISGLVMDQSFPCDSCDNRISKNQIFRCLHMKSFYNNHKHIDTLLNDAQQKNVHSYHEDIFDASSMSVCSWQSPSQKAETFAKPPYQKGWSWLYQTLRRTKKSNQRYLEHVNPSPCNPRPRKSQKVNYQIKKLIERIYSKRCLSSSQPQLKWSPS